MLSAVKTSFTINKIDENFFKTRRNQMAKKESAFMKPVGVSEDLAEIVGSGPMPRTEVTKKVWEYIKKHQLQDTKNKRRINPDSKLAKVLGSNQSIDMFEMTSKISAHLKPTLAKAN